jgi:hypothetical protein
VPTNDDAAAEATSSVAAATEATNPGAAAEDVANPDEAASSGGAEVGESISGEATMEVA